ncbi:MAG: disulfide bond formation protein DsbA, partial [Acidobacteria bacterium]|nr:disulfide bond formation protein DsbA [Acidobacteriota bacterium]
MKQSTLFVVALVGLLLAFLAGRSYYSSSQNERAAASADATMALLVRPHSPTLGPTNAPVVIV